jgi:hypothetical protein
MTYHRAYLAEVLARLQGPQGLHILERATALTRKWDTVPGTDPWLGQRWRELLQRPADEIAATLLAGTEEAERLGHTMPFAGILTNAERAKLRRIHGRPRAHP